LPENIKPEVQTKVTGWLVICCLSKVEPHFGSHPSVLWVSRCGHLCKWQRKL